MQSLIRCFGEARRVKAEIPAQTRGIEHERSESQKYCAIREAMERRSMLRGLIVIAVAVLAGSIARAGLDRVFVPGWWRP